jgi:hypothetical protein
MSLLSIELKKPREGPPSLACVRPDGSRTWARLHPFFPLHDLTHCAVESVLGFTEAFFGLVASGWAIDDFARPGVARQLPPEALWAEHLVGLIERSVASTAQQVNDALGASLPESLGRNPPALSEKQWARIQALRTQLSDLWQNLPAGETLRVEFPVVSEADGGLGAEASP